MRWRSRAAAGCRRSWRIAGCRSSARGRAPADLPLGRHPGRQRRDLQPRRPARDPRARPASRPRRQRDGPAPLPFGTAALDRPSGRDVRLRAGDAGPGHRGARPAGHQAALPGADWARGWPSPRSSRRSTGSAADEIEPIPPGALYDSRDGARQWYRMPHGAAEPEPGLDVERDRGRAAPGAGGGGGQVDGGRRRGGRVPVRRARQLDHRGAGRAGVAAAAEDLLGRRRGQRPT